SSGPDLGLVCIAAPAFVVVLVESAVARANANWAGASYPACALLCAGALSRWRLPTLQAATVGVQVVILVGFMLGTAAPDV
ncbi:hypothetical protein ABTN03_20220, partial [Acinetobacter baumannii]